MPHILIVDDDELTLQVVKAILQKDRYKVTTATDGHSALELLRHTNFDLIVSDANMPHGMSGFNLVTAIRSDPRTATIPIIFLTGRREERDVLRAIQLGANDYLVKPVEAASLLAKIFALLKRDESSPSLPLTPLSVSAKTSIELMIVGVSEQGFELQSAVELAPDTVLKLESSFFDTLKVEAPELRIISSRRNKLGSSTFLIATEIVNPDATIEPAIREWVAGQKSLMPKKESS